jgi:2-iminobutanoate/2-iminopropanoate deaminase
MSDRRSIRIEGLSHQTAIPVASRIGPLLVSSVISPFNPGSRDVPPDAVSQARNIFHHVDLMLKAGGGGWSDVAKMEFWVVNVEGRAAIEGLWIERFPDPQSRPARHTHVGGVIQMSATFLAWING